LSVLRPSPRVEEGRGGHAFAADDEKPWKRSPFLSRRFVVGSLVAFGILVANALVSYRTIANLIESSQTVEDTLKLVAALKDVQESVVNSETELRGYIISGERERLIQAQAFLGSASNLVQPLHALSAATPAQVRQIESLDALISEEIDRFATLIEIHRRKGMAAAIRTIRATA